jgi:hypothetical protein
MSESEFDGVFDEDFLYFPETFLAERTPEEVERIVELFELEPGTEILAAPAVTPDRELARGARLSRDWARRPSPSAG